MYYFIAVDCMGAMSILSIQSSVRSISEVITAGCISEAYRF